VVNTLWVLKVKRGPDGKVIKKKSRVVYDGRGQKAYANKMGIEYETFAPTARHTTFKCQCARACVRGRRTRQFDVEGAYLKGDYGQCAEFKDHAFYARPPPNFPVGTRYRKVDERGVPLVWRLKAPLYGKIEAALVWFKTARAQLVDKQSFNQSEYDPCYFYKKLDDGTTMDITLYVDDANCTDEHSELADAELRIFQDSYTSKQTDAPEFFLGSNLSIESDSRMTLSSKAYVTQLAKKYLPKPLSEYPHFATPADKTLMAEYDAALKTKGTATKEMCATYASKCGAAIYAVPASRVDCAQAVGICSRCLTFPTKGMDEKLDRVIAYMAQHAERGVTYDKKAARASELHAYSDSDWAVAHSTSGHAIMFGGASIGFMSKRQHSIALSSTEAEIMAASQAACEIMYFRGLLSEMGEDMSKPTVLYVDNQGAVVLAKHKSSCQRSRHIERRYLKIRELVAEGHIEVRYVATAENASDLLTKPLAKDLFDKHRATLSGQP